MLALAKVGRNPDTGLGAGDVAYRLIHNDTFPSWGFSIKHGATSIRERWNGWTSETGFGAVGAAGGGRRRLFIFRQMTARTA
jgi:alpha-L-rhamnosidase